MIRKASKKYTNERSLPEPRSHMYRATTKQIQVLKVDHKNKGWSQKAKEQSLHIEGDNYSPEQHVLTLVFMYQTAADSISMVIAGAQTCITKTNAQCSMSTKIIGTKYASQADCAGKVKLI